MITAAVLSNRVFLAGLFGSRRLASRHAVQVFDIELTHMFSIQEFGAAFAQPMTEA